MRSSRCLRFNRQGEEHRDSFSARIGGLLHGDKSQSAFHQFLSSVQSLN